MLTISGKCSISDFRVECASVINITSVINKLLIVLFRKSFLSLVNLHTLNDLQVIESETFTHSNVYKTVLLKV